MNNRVDLNPEFAFVEKIGAPDKFAFKFNFGVFVRSVDGSLLKCLFHDTERSLNAPLAWSPDGSTLYHAYDQVYAINVSTASAKAITSFSERFSVNLHLHSTPDGARLVFYRDAKLQPVPDLRGANPVGATEWISINTDGSEQYEFPTYAKLPWVDPDYFWWPSQTEGASCLLWKENIPSEHGIRVWSMDSRGDGRTLRATFLARDRLQFVMSPDGRAIAFGYDHERGAHDGAYAGLFVRRLPDESDVLVSTTGHAPSWSPDSRLMSYLDRAALWIYDLPKRKKTKLLAIPGDDPSPSVNFRLDERSTPSWSPDGRFIAFWLHRPNESYFDRKGQSIEPEDFESRHGLVDLEQKNIFLLKEGYWEHVAWQPQTHR